MIPLTTRKPIIFLFVVAANEQWYQTFFAKFLDHVNDFKHSPFSKNHLPVGQLLQALVTYPV